ncbi:hypothetical protein M1403_03135 [Patescibacteria group bacterium]|nr:hypothetical protein [Patescibacteria group bacterium]
MMQSPEISPTTLEGTHLRVAWQDIQDLWRGNFEVMEFYPTEELFPGKNVGERISLLSNLISDMAFWWTGVGPDCQKDPRLS